MKIKKKMIKEEKKQREKGGGRGGGGGGVSGHFQSKEHGCLYMGCVGTELLGYASWLDQSTSISH